ncbi:hypothetical protein [Rothia sp. P7208]|uniref:hypothetical protein n=1 Tax=Rothia sp. P7208 TaxID=3402660 RepID=UPI003AC82C05
MSQKPKTSQRSLIILSTIVLTVLTGCTPPPQNFEELKYTPAQEEHLNELKEWIFPPQEAEQARRKFTARCVQARGGVYEEPAREYQLKISFAGGLTAQEISERGYRPSSQELAQAHYDTAGKAAFFGDAQNGTVSTDFMDYHSGDIPRDGCMAQSYQYIYGTVQDGMNVALLAPTFAQTIRDDVHQDKDYQKLVEQWSACMEKAGYADLHTVEAAEDVASSSTEQQQKDIAQADARCRTDISYDQKTHDIENGYYEAVYQRLKQVSSQIKKIHQRALENVAHDRENPQNSSPIEQPSPTPSSSMTDTTAQPDTASAGASATAHG